MMDSIHSAKEAQKSDCISALNFASTGTNLETTTLMIIDCSTAMPRIALMATNLEVEL